jgi:hypothetical protein
MKTSKYLALAIFGFVACILLPWSIHQQEPGLGKDSQAQKNTAEVQTLSFSSQTGYQTCTAMKGNGEKIFVTMGALARITENYGLMDALSGGSSGSISAFFYESMLLNPSLKKCGAGQCSEGEVRARMALLLKSFEGYVEYMSSQPEVQGLLAVPKLEAKIKAIGLRGADSKDIHEVIASLIALLRDPEYRGLINPEILRSFESLNVVKTERRIKNLVRVLRTAKDPGILSSDLLIQSGLVNMKQVTDSAGLIGDFYSWTGGGDAAAWDQFFNECASSTVGKSWEAIKDNSNCGKTLTTLIQNYKQLRGKSPTSVRLTEKVGTHIPTLISISVLTGQDVVEDFKNVRNSYQELIEIKFTPPSGSYHLGYAGLEKDLSRVKNNIKKYVDFKTEHYIGLKDMTWSEAMLRSISEPGLSSLLPMTDDMLSAGGWSDNAPTLVLRNLGCEKVIFITRRGDEDPFSGKIATLLGLNPQDRHKLLAIDPMPGVDIPALGLSLKESSVVWCTDWNKDKIQNIPGMFEDGYSAPAQVNSDEDFFMHGQSPYAGMSQATHLPGCQVTGF